MQTTVRTTIRIRKDLLDQSKLIALKKGVSLQEIINDTLAMGFGHISDLNTVEEAMERIDAFRESQVGKKIDLKKLLAESKKDQR
jgi:hypothetical protein